MLLDNILPINEKDTLQSSGWTTSLELQRLVRALTENRPCEVKPDLHTGPTWAEAVRWSCKAWKNIYLALMLRRKESSILRHPIHEAPCEKFITDLAIRYCEGKAIPWLKFHTCYLFAVHSKQAELPEVPSCLLDGKPNLPGILGGGWVYQRCRRILQGRPDDFAAALDMLYSKYGMPKAPDSFIAETLLGHRSNFSGPPKHKVLDLRIRRGDTTKIVKQDRISTVKSIKQRVDDLCHLVFKEKYDGKLTVPKQSASFGLACSKGGQLRELINEFWAGLSLSDYERLREYSVISLRRNLRRMVELRPGKVFEEYDDDVSCLLGQAFVEATSFRAMSRIFEQLRARQFGIAEPLKVRVILAAQAEEMFLTTSFQKYMHNAVRSVDPFEFIGLPDNADRINRCFGCHDVTEEGYSVESLKDGEEYVSGDYSAATDNLDPELSNSCWESICKYGGMTADEKELGIKALTRHRLYASKQLPDWKNDEGIDQQNGQSMGSPMSFPILCLINLACWSLAYGYEPSHLLSAPVRVNGDDIVFRGESSIYESWWALNSVAGLFPSKGKNYRSTDFVNINSHTYQLKDSHFEKVPVVNMAIVQNMVRKGLSAGERSAAPWFLQKANYDALTSGFSARIQRNLRKVFLEHSDAPSFLACDLPVRCGGPGFNVGSGFSELARKQAALFMTSNDHDCFLKLRPVVSDQSEVGQCMNDFKKDRSHSWHSRVFKQEAWSCHEGNMRSGDVLGQLLFTQSSGIEGKVRNEEIYSGDAWMNQSNDAYTTPDFLYRRARYEDALSKFYSKQKIEKAFFARSLGSVDQWLQGLQLGYQDDSSLPQEISHRDSKLAFCTEEDSEGCLHRRPDWIGLHLADIETCRVLNQNWAIETLQWDCANVVIDYRSAFTKGCRRVYQNLLSMDLEDGGAYISALDKDCTERMQIEYTLKQETDDLYQGSCRFWDKLLDETFKPYYSEFMENID